MNELEQQVYDTTFHFIFSGLNVSIFDFDILIDFDKEVYNLIKYKSTPKNGLIRIQRLKDYFDEKHLTHHRWFEELSAYFEKVISLESS